MWISLEEDLWPYDKEPVQAVRVAAQLGIEIALECMVSEIPFAWPGLGELTSSTSEYTQLMLDAFEVTHHESTWLGDRHDARAFSGLSIV